MPVVGLNITSIDADYNNKKSFGGDVNINSTPSILDVEVIDSNIKGINQLLQISFRFDVTYTPKIGSISLEGELLYQADDPQEVFDHWKSKKKMDDDMTVEILNSIMRKCLVKAIYLSDELRLPTPLMFPIVRKSEKSAEED